ncbi:MAG: reductive dehalogenase domain-containing protein [Pseudomonadota bacterium]
MRLRSYRKRPFHLGPYPLERLKRGNDPDLTNVPPFRPLTMKREAEPASVINAMTDYEAVLDAIRDGIVKPTKGVLPEDLTERANHLKSFGYYCDASQAGTCSLTPEMFLDTPVVNPDVARLAEDMKTRQTKTLASGIDVIMADLKDAMSRPPSTVTHHSHALVLLFEYPRDPKPDEPGASWITDAQAERACLRGAEVGAIIANYIRLLGYEARAHNATATDIDLNKLCVAAGLAEVKDGMLVNPYLGRRFGITAITTTFAIAADRPLATAGLADRLTSHGPGWYGMGAQAKNALNREAFANRRYVDGAHPFETLKRVDKPTTYIDEDRVARVPKRTDMFARAQFGDMGKAVQDGAKMGNYVRKSALAFAFRQPLGAFVLMQDGPAAPEISPDMSDEVRNAENIKAALYFLGADAVGISRCPDWAYYSHDAAGEPLPAYHANAISVIVDQGHETMEGASGDDWVACAQSMRAYLRFSLLGGIVAEQIRRLGYTARTHTVMDGEVLQPPLLLLAGLGEVSRIGEVILNPFLGPRLKSGAITTNMPLAHDKPIDFGLQNFCQNCNKCARECPSGAITAGPKLMFNGYEIWKSDSQRCTQYRITVQNGAMCGRCMKTCPWNLEGLFAEKPFRWAAMNFPKAARHLAALDDRLGNGALNITKKWWWDLEMVNEGPYSLTEKEVNARNLQPELDLKYEDQVLAVYPANLAPPPYPFPFPMDREKGIAAYQAMIPAAEYRARLARGETVGLAHDFRMPEGPPPVIQVEVARAEKMTPEITKYEFRTIDGASLPPLEAGAHIDVVVSPEFFRQYSLSGDPADRSKYQIGVLREDDGRGGSKQMHRIFNEGRKVWIGRPINHFPLEESASRTLLMGGGIGITPMIAMAHRLHAIGAPFEMHYSCSKRANAGYLADLAAAPWAEHVHFYFSDEGTRADFDHVLKAYDEGAMLYACGPDRYMSAVLETGARLGWPEDALRREYFSVPEQPEWENHEFTLRLKDGREVLVAADEAPTDALKRLGVHVDVKCSDGICGVCKCGVRSGAVEHRDFVLGPTQRETEMILCSSRAKEPGGVIEIDR